MKRIGLFGGSFDPVHHGHIEAVESFLNSDLIDEIWILLTPDPPHKTDQKKTDFEHRFTMLKLAFQESESTKISDIENELPKPSYTLRTIHHLKEKYPEYTFFLCLGEDSLQTFHKWHKYDEILKECTLMVVDRPGSDHSDVNSNILEKTIFVDHKPVDISSTEIRQTSDSSSLDNLPDEVQNYIQKNNLYTDSR
ncbi:nicotinate (nicotinamide) nucleotide adenylyltransferase [Rhodohalobacter sp.]|uniref:nicotinate (nicotinamide) nucleotide adenylyltransferase n=1 Tax=Rhodohalobacter sp. TaxID=1974210 RepID=UPI002ACE4B40|nr:nicotinate (nicotinamide) nucleotide adenylyltransferase [Rhodohalobacter sp.]MDZ7757675.1 nicotinate (nicotinamide) nucleotide adenylyltransferase [Rhodohalobacter sp.]